MKKRQFLAPLVISLGALLGTVTATEEALATTTATQADLQNRANAITETLKDQVDLHEFVITRDENNMIIAQHRSHYSHRSHSSHRSHYSGY
ncbi:MAG: His-Xaa-Ser repeat protein HxsA2 [Candidatus Obscuribacterales bacterium]|nr:His-Xaa-Ser repeat protein HxsA2 [Candidatus Obscuribacterales bacterium]